MPLCSVCFCVPLSLCNFRATAHHLTFACWRSLTELRSSHAPVLLCGRFAAMTAGCAWRTRPSPSPPKMRASPTAGAFSLVCLSRAVWCSAMQCARVANRRCVSSPDCGFCEHRRPSLELAAECYCVNRSVLLREPPSDIPSVSQAASVLFAARRRLALVCLRFCLRPCVGCGRRRCCSCAGRCRRARCRRCCYSRRGCPEAGIVGIVRKHVHEKSTIASICERQRAQLVTQQHRQSTIQNRQIKQK